MAVLLGAATMAAPACAQERARSVLGGEASQEDVTRAMRSIVVTPTGPTGSGTPQEVSLLIAIEFDFGKATLTRPAQARLCGDAGGSSAIGICAGQICAGSR
jgi:hypothetical protein